MKSPLVLYENKTPSMLSSSPGYQRSSLKQKSSNVDHYLWNILVKGHES